MFPENRLLARHVDGHDYMWAVSEMIDRAKEAIFILVCVITLRFIVAHHLLQQDWWLTPELYLRRPPAYFPEWRIDHLLKKKAEQGVKVHIVVYKEVRFFGRPTTPLFIR